MAEIEFETPAWTAKFWNIIEDLFNLPNKFEGTVFSMAARCGFNVDSFFYREVLPVMKNNSIMTEISKEKKLDKGYAASVYHFNRDNLTKFCIKHNKRLKAIFKVWVIGDGFGGDADPDWLQKIEEDKLNG